VLTNAAQCRGLQPARATNFDNRSLCRCRRISAWQKQLERRAMARLAVDREMSVGLFGKTERHRKPEAGASGRSLRGKERVEDSADYICRYAYARVTGFDENIVPDVKIGMLCPINRVDLKVTCCDFEAAAVRHRFTRICCEVN
jgi:hypothetical protein